MQSDPQVYIVDDDEAVRSSLQWLMESVEIPTLAFASAREFIETCSPDVPGCLVLDIRMPGMSGLELQERLNGMGYTVPLIFITGHGDVQMAVRALKAGAFDFIEKPFNDQLLLDCVNHALHFDRKQRARLVDQEGMRRRVERLTPRESEVMALVVDGLSNRVIGDRLGVSQKTVEAHRAKVMEKMCATSLSELVRMVVQLGGQ
jgi:FixJ family two-component response regulator